MEKLKVSFLLGALALLLGGCAGLSGDFTCSDSATGSCLPVDKVNQQAQAGVFSPLATPVGELQTIWIARADGRPIAKTIRVESPGWAQFEEAGA